MVNGHGSKLHPTAPYTSRFSSCPAVRFGLALSLALIVLLATFSFVRAQDGAPPAAPASDQSGSQPTEQYCLSCHSQPDLTLRLPSGEVVSLNITQEMLHKSIHSQIGIECRACHTDISTYPHPPIAYQSHRELSRTYYLSCQKCHKDMYDLTQDSMHAQAAKAGNLEAPICTDCHGVHDIQPAGEPRAHISQICGRCHSEIYTQYKNSVHGAALINENNPDVPVCTDCHGVHNINDPRTNQFRVETPEMCARCHADQKLMAKYGINVDVYNLYKLSWHGVDVSVYKAKWPNLWHNSAVCTDCHGVHDILATSNPSSRVNSQNLLATCQQCHPDAGPKFVGAWTGHNQVSLQRTPFVFYTKAFYDYFTPSVLVLSAVYVALQIIHAVVDRVRKSLS